MPDAWSWRPDDTGLDDADFPPFDLGDDETPCVSCGETECARSLDGVQSLPRARPGGRLCTGALPGPGPGQRAADDAGEDAP